MAALPEVTVVALSGDYFASLYQGLLGGSAEYVASVLREDGTLLAHYPETGAMSAPDEQDELISAIAERVRGGMIASGSPFDAPGTVVAYKRLAIYPVYVAIGRTKASILDEWLEIDDRLRPDRCPRGAWLHSVEPARAAPYAARAEGPCAGARRSRPTCGLGGAAPPGAEGRGRRAADRRNRA